MSAERQMQPNWEKLKQKLSTANANKPKKYYFYSNSRRKFSDSNKRKLKKEKLEINKEKESENKKYVALDCEMVEGESGDDLLAQVAMVDYNGNIIYNTYVHVEEKIVDYRTVITGIVPKHLKSETAKPFEVVQQEVTELLKNKVLVGHGLENDLKVSDILFQVLFLTHPKNMIRDTSYFHVFRRVTNTVLFIYNIQGKSYPQSLKNITLFFLKRKIQFDVHSPVLLIQKKQIEDAQAAMELYRMYKNQWEKELFIVLLLPNKQKNNRQ